MGTVTSQDSASLLYRRLATLRRVLPAGAALVVFIYEIAAVLWLKPSWQSSPVGVRALILELLIYAVAGPILLWLTLTWILRRVEERDEAEAHLRSLYWVSWGAATTTDVGDLVEIALSMPWQVLSPVGTSLILREGPEGHWVLAGTRGFQPQQREALEAYLVSAGVHLRCGSSDILTATEGSNCPILQALPKSFRTAVASVICMPLSSERPPHAVLSVFLPEEKDLSVPERQTLESMVAGLSVALDHARLRDRELQMLGRMEQAVRQREDLVAALDDMLSDVATAYRAERGVVFLVSAEEGTVLDAVASWPNKNPPTDLEGLAKQALREHKSVTDVPPQERQHGAAVRLTVEGQTIGVLALAGQRSISGPQMTLLNAAAEIMALVVRSSQLYQRLETEAVLDERGRLAREIHDGLAQDLGFLNVKLQQVDRLLDRQDVAAARQALGELRAGIQRLYDEVRETLRDLRWRPVGAETLCESLEHLVADFAERSGLEVSLSVDGEPGLPAPHELQLLRIAQEALTNVQRHAAARHVRVRLAARAADVMLEVEDDGIGVPSEVREGLASYQAPGHFGLRHARERAEHLGGRLELHSVPEQGTTLQVTVPRSHALGAEGGE